MRLTGFDDDLITGRLSLGSPFKSSELLERELLEWELLELPLSPRLAWLL